MAFARAVRTEALLIHAWPYRETDFLVELMTEKCGRIRCHMRNSRPEAFRPFEIKVTQIKGYFTTSDFRYTQALLIRHNEARLIGLYVNELVYRLVPTALPDESLYGSYLATLAHLEVRIRVQAALRFFEQRVLQLIGHALDYRTDRDSQGIVEQQSYNFIPNSGFDINPEGRYTGRQLLSVAQADYDVAGALTLARECQQQQIEAILQPQALFSRKWSIATPALHRETPK
ncbi:MAG: DNA repair protein RecO (recombination protein O) [Reinekea sp.]|jgi:DNA repair protein RecO (recombination protein O)